MLNKKSLSCLLVLSFFILPHSTLANAHQPVALTSAHTTPNKGPILVDGTISFALRANFTKANQQQGFRASLKEGELLNFEYLIIDKLPENKMALSKLPVVTITAPDGAKSIVKFTERTAFYEPYGRTNYLFLARFSQPAISGIYSFAIKSKARADITVSTGSKEIRGEVYEPATCPTVTPSNPVVITNAQAAALIGMKKAAAIDCVNSFSATYRIAQEDGESFALTKDYRMDRVDLSISKGIVTKATVG
jgi:hypothetical protein